MYFLMVLFFALQITLLLFCLGIFVKKMCCDSYPEETSDNVHIGNVNLGHTPDCENDTYDEKKQKILKYLKDPNNKDCIIFTPAPDSPLVNNWVGDGNVTSDATQSYLSIDSAASHVRPESRMSVNTLDSVNVVGGHTKWMCPICLNYKEVNTIGLPCKHTYHKACLKDYVVYSLEHNLPFKCPICRCNLQINLDYKRKDLAAK
ncbi:uncharacterized protein LOC142352013 [Convolutriloba macropyga]|uniref:uncharacterized protein LOC142352013 n=1 Tax=Convolutriloba macropyga TaxID=536237 RepID=UPI003F52398D